MTDNLPPQDEQQIPLPQDEQQVPLPQDQDDPKTRISEPKPEQPPPAQPNDPAHLSFTIWPPTQRTRDAVTARLIETLSTQSVLSKRYGTLPHDEASEVAKRIENDAFSTVGTCPSGENDGIELLQLYSKQISTLMLDTVRSRSGQKTDGEMNPTASTAVRQEVSSEMSTDA